MIEHRPFDQLPSEDFGWLKVRRHFCATVRDHSSGGGWGRIRIWNDEEIVANAGFAMQRHASVEIITYVREGVVTHRDSLGNEGRIEAGSVQVVSAGTGIRHTEYNLEHSPALIFQIWVLPNVPGGSPAWGVQPCPTAGRSGCFVAIASGWDDDHEALPIRAHARVSNAKMKLGETVEHALGVTRFAYLVPSTGVVDVNGVRIYARDGAAIKDIDIVTVAAVEDADVFLINVP